MTNPNDSVGTNAGYDGRTTPKAFNDVLSALSAGILSGWACSPKSGMTVQIGGGSDRDVAIAEDNSGNRTTINNRSGAPIEVTISGAPATNNRIDAIVAYVDAAQSGTGATSVDFPEAVGFITVEGTIAANPTAPDDAAIRAAITADGSTGANAYYVVLATILVGTGVTTIGSGVITAGANSQLSTTAGSAISAQVASIFNLTSHATQNFTANYLGSSVTCNGTFYLDQSADSSTFKAYGNIYISRTTSSAATLTLPAVPGLSGQYGIKTSLRLSTPPSEAFVISAAGVNLRVNSDNTNTTGSYMLGLAVGSDGYIYIGAASSSSLSVAANSQLRWILHPCLYFNSNFGNANE